jgi:hypothetical protein
MKYLMIAAAAMLAPQMAFAQDCLDQVEAFAAKIGANTGLPPAGRGPNAPEGTPKPDSSDLAESGGVIAPPKTGSDMPTFEPQPAPSTPMPTAPQIEPGMKGGASELGAQAAENAQIQSLLTAARQAANTGDNQRCLDRLQEATALAADGGA